MRRPTPDRLLQGVHEGLLTSVMPHVDDPAARRQLKAALHIIDRLSHSWDRERDYVLAENDDVRATLRDLAASLPDAALAARLEALDAVGDPIAEYDSLHALLEDVGAKSVDVATGRPNLAALRLRELYDRMLDREAQAWAL